MITNFFKGERIKSGKTQAQFAKQIGVSARTIWAIEKGDSVKRETLDKACKALGHKLEINVSIVPIKK